MFAILCYGMLIADSQLLSELSLFRFIVAHKFLWGDQFVFSLLQPTYSFFLDKGSHFSIVDPQLWLSICMT